MKNRTKAFIARKQTQMFYRAVALHESGNLNEAEQGYRKLLKLLPTHPALLTNFGTLLLQKGNIEEGTRLLSISLNIAPEQPDALNNIGNAYKDLNCLDEALTYFDRAIIINPFHADAYFNRGVVLKCLNRPLEALASYDRSLILDPSNLDTHFNRGLILQALNRLDEALFSYNHIISLNPFHANAYLHQGNVLTGLQLLHEALISYQQAIAITPDNNNIYFNRAITLTALQRLDEALDNYRQAIALNPNDPAAYSNQGNILIELNRLDEALACYECAIAIKPNDAEAHYNRGIVLNKLRRFQDALTSYDNAILINPNYTDAYINRGVILQDLQRLEEAIACYDQAIAINCNSESGHYNKGVALQLLNHVDEALASYEQAIAINPANINAHWGKSLICLLKGDYLQGWKLYEWRWKKNPLISLARQYQQPLWLGNSSLKNKILFIYPEQGLGDYIQFCRYVIEVRKLGAKVILETPSALHSIMSTFIDQDSLVEKGQFIPPFDYHCPMMSLPLAFKTTVATIPSPIPYLKADKNKQADWRQQLTDDSRLKVGLAWSGSIEHTTDSHRSISATKLLPLLKLPIEFHCLQKEIRPQDRAVAATVNNLIIHHDHLIDFSDTAALIENMDLVLSVDTSVAHLAGALGKEVWLLLPYAPDYRWMLNRDDTPWYPSTTLFRQPVIGDWDSVILKIRKRFNSLLDNKK